MRFALLFCCLLGTSSLHAQTPDAEKIKALVGQLGSPDFNERRSAYKELESFGQAAVPELKKAAQERDLEVRTRANDLLRKFEEKKTQQDVLAPKNVRLNVKNVTLQAAIDELAKQSGYTLTVQGDRTSLGEVKITLDTGDVTFFEALDLLCDAGGLTESSPAPSAIDPNIPGLPRPLRPGGKIRVLPAPIQKLPFKIQAQPIQIVPAPALPVPAQPVPAQPAPAIAPVQLVAQEEKPAPVAPRQPPIFQPAPAPVPLPQAAQVLFDFAEVAQPTVSQVNRPIVLTVAKSIRTPTSYHGSTRMRLLSVKPGPNNDWVLTFDVAVEPRLGGIRAEGTPSLEKAVDDRGQSLVLAMEQVAKQPPVGEFQMPQIMFDRLGGQANRTRVTLRLAKGEKDAKVLAELRGSITGEVDVPNEKLFEFTDVLKSAGKKAQSGDKAFELKSVVKDKAGNYVVQLHADAAMGNNGFGGINGRVVIQGGGMVVINGQVISGQPSSADQSPLLIDAKGKSLMLVKSDQSMVFDNGKSSTQMTYTFRPHPDQGEPVTLVRYGMKPTKVRIPFSFQNLPLP